MIVTMPHASLSKISLFCMLKFDMVVPPGLNVLLAGKDPKGTEISMD